MRGATSERRPRRSRSARVVSLAVARGTGGVVATSRRQPGRCGSQPLPGGAVPSAPAHRTGRAGLLAPGEAADGSTRAHRDGASAGGARAPRPRRRTAIRARGRGDGDRAPRRRAGCRAAVVVLQPDRSDRGARPTHAGELLGELDAPVEREEAINAGVRLREAIAGSSLDFDRDSHLAHVDRDAEQTIVVATTAGRTGMGWLHGAMLTRQPFCLCVYVHALERRRERQRLKLAYRRLFTINRGAESRGRVPDFDRYVQEREYEGLLGQIASGQQTGLFHVSIYEKLRARGPDPDLAALSRGGRLLRRADRVRRRLQGQPRQLPPAAAVGEHAAARPRRARAGRASTRPSTRRHAAAGRDQVRVADRDPVRVRRPGPHRRAAEPLRRAAPQPHAADRRPQRQWQDDVSECADVAVLSRTARVRS